MGIKKFKPVTPSSRFRTVNDRVEISREEPERSLLEPIRKSGGRNSDGHITIRHRGGGHKRHYRRIDFKRDKLGVPGRVASIEYDPNRSANIALIHYADGEKRYILAPSGLTVGAVIEAGPDADMKVGNSLPLSRASPAKSVRPAFTRSTLVWIMLVEWAMPSVWRSTMPTISLTSRTVSLIVPKPDCAARLRSTPLLISVVTAPASRVSSPIVWAI